MEVLLKDYWYELPKDKIAINPLSERSQSKLLVFKDSKIVHSNFYELNKFLPENSTLFFNNTKVIPARLLFQKETGATIEIFLLNPISPSSVLSEVMSSTKSSQWVCTIGNLKRWNEGLILSKNTSNQVITAKLIDRDQGIVEFEWQSETLTFAEVINSFGATPLPPYIDRELTEADKNRYQTVYSHYEGAVAAPTAGLHFTKEIIDEIEKAGHHIEYLTLHVSAGTFQPIKVENAAEHEMHNEQIIITRKNIEALLNTSSIICVGTTSLRTLESLYWYGVNLLVNKNEVFSIKQSDSVELPQDISKSDALKAVIELMDNKGLDSIVGETSIYIIPGYKFRIADTIITNFHQPGSTLILLIAAFIGASWEEIYKAALENDYRFLSYGDSSLLFKKN
jgi:S-adenosylmethionine:tRNA ribosyltransferase-isomerase